MEDSERIEGRQPVFEALRAGRPINKVLIANGTERGGIVSAIVGEAKARGIPVEFVERDVFERQLGATEARGVLAFTAAHGYLSLEDMLLIPGQKGEPALFVVLDGVEDPHNLGAVLRTADAAGAHGVVIRSRRAVGLTGAVARASAGAIEYVPVARVNNISRAIEELKQANIWVTGIDMSGPVPFTKVDFKTPTALVVGGEGQGLAPLVAKKCDNLASIPMRGQVGSLNASVAAALALYEARRQRDSAQP
jgi:23S rRNA (guanosine2251-2'-O)-methyltransferase